MPVISARILVPADHGMMEMTAIVSGYVATFEELGLGAGIIERGLHIFPH